MTDKEKIAYIWNHFGQEAQLEKFFEEANELIEAVREGDKEHIIEELADCFVMLDQIATAFNIQSIEVILIVLKKIDRTIERIESKHYEVIKDVEPVVITEYSFKDGGEQ